MLPNIQRRVVVQSVAGVLAGWIAIPRVLAQSTTEQRERPDPLSDEMVQDFVRVAHGNLDRTRELLDAEPRLIKASWDWGGGDFESALGAAGHMGRRDIAHLLLDRGAPLELCAAAMLGQLEVVQAMLAARPSLIHVPGPHGIPLLAHAKRGGESAAAVAAYLIDFERTHPKPNDDATHEASKLGGTYAGIYRGRFQDREVGYEVVERGNGITLKPLDGREPQDLEPDGEHRFKHSAFGVLVAFSVESGEARSLKAVQRDLEIELLRVQD